MNPNQDPWDAVPGQQTPPGAPGYGYPPPQPPQMPPPYFYPGYQPRRTNGLAIASLVCGICGFLYVIPAILGIIFGAVAVRQIKRDGTEGRGMAIAGMAVGAAWLALVALLVVVLVAASN